MEGRYVDKYFERGRLILMYPSWHSCGNAEKPYGSISVSL